MIVITITIFFLLRLLNSADSEVLDTGKMFIFGGIVVWRCVFCDVKIVSDGRVVVVLGFQKD